MEQSGIHFKGMKHNILIIKVMILLTERRILKTLITMRRGMQVNIDKWNKLNWERKKEMEKERRRRAGIYNSIEILFLRMLI